METESSKASSKLMNQDIIKLEQFDGSNFGRWKDKMIFFLTAMKLYYILDPALTPLPEPTAEETQSQKNARMKRAEDALLCRGHILNALSYHLYNFYKETSTATEIWNALDFNYKLQKLGTNKS